MWLHRRDSARELLSKTSLRVSLLPAHNTDQRQKVAPEYAGSKLAALKDLKGRVGLIRLQSLWQKLASAYNVWTRGAAEGRHTKQRRSEAEAAPSEVSLAADNWWESSTVISGWCLPHQLLPVLYFQARKDRSPLRRAFPVMAKINASPNQLSAIV